MASGEEGGLCRNWIQLIGAGISGEVFSPDGRQLTAAGRCRDGIDSLGGRGICSKSHLILSAPFSQLAWKLKQKAQNHVKIQCQGRCVSASPLRQHSTRSHGLKDCLLRTKGHHSGHLWRQGEYPQQSQVIIVWLSGKYFSVQFLRKRKEKGLNICNN